MTTNVYTTEVVSRITKEYLADPTLENARKIAEEIGVTERSIIAKLSALGVYQRKTYTTKMGTAPVKKEEYIDRIAELLNIDICLLESLEKVTKQALILMATKIEEKGMDKLPPPM